MAKINKTTKNKFWLGFRGRASLFTDNEIENWSRILEIRAENTQKSKNKSTVIPTYTTP